MLLSFNARQTAVVVPRRMLDLPVMGADPELRKTLQQRVQALWRMGDLDTLTHIRRLLRPALLKGDVTAIEIASQLGVSHRTLSRRLETLGTGFQEVLNQMRFEFAQQLLANTRLGIGDIATIVGYSDPSVLSRAFSRWAGITPSEWRSSMSTSRMTPEVQSFAH